MSDFSVAKADYQAARNWYHKTGEQLRKNNTPANRKQYNQAKREYHKAGDILAKEFAKKNK